VRRLRLVLAIAFGLAVAGIGAFVVLEQTMPDWYARLRYPLHYASIVRAEARGENLDPALLAAVISTESKFDPGTVSSAGAVGLMQLMPQTAQGIAEHTGGVRFVQSDLRNPAINVRYGAWYLRHLELRYAAQPDAEGLALAAYNAGQGVVDRWIAETPPGQRVVLRYPETRSYVSHVRSLQHIFRRAWPHELGY
jgi:soluble lytic murein transglycosylase